MISTISLLLKLLCGVALFLYGMGVMGDGLKKAAGNKLEALLYKLTSTPIKGLLLGAGVTAVIQSSSATSVMVVGFVNSGMMKVAQAISIIVGANIGTSITGWVLCLSYIDGSSGIAALLSTSTISAVCAIVGIVLKNFTKKSSNHHFGEILLGFAVLMTGMQMMSSAVSPLKDSPTFINMLTMFSNPMLGMLIGIVFTAILQSASASVGILQALSVTGGISFATAYPIILGIGVGASFPVLLSGFSSNKNGKRTSLIYLLNTAEGMIVCAIAFYAANAIMGGFGFLGMTMNPFNIALLNTVFRIASALVFMPFIKFFEKLVFTLVKDSAEEIEEQKDFNLLEERFLKYPDLAIAQSHQALSGMAKKTKKNILRAMNLLTVYDEKKFSKVLSKESLIDKYEDKLSKYLMRLTGAEMTETQSKETAECLRVLSDFERMSDHSAGIAYVVRDMQEKKITFSKNAQAELAVLTRATEDIVNQTNACFVDTDLEAAMAVEPLRQLIDTLCDEMKSRHVLRLQQGKCTVEQGFPFNDLLTNIARIAAHSSNVAIAVIEQKSEVFDTHAYTRSVREMKEAGSAAIYDEIAAKYLLPNSEDIETMELPTEEVFDDAE